MLTDWTFDPLQLAPVVLAGVAYATRARTLRRRGTPMPTWRVLLFATGLGLLLLAFASPIAAIGEKELFSFHMLQHVLIGDLAPLCLLAGLNGPMLRPLLAFRPVERLRVLANPVVALPIWATNLYVWHLPFLYEAAVEHSVVHALEHMCFFSAGIVAWLPVLETLPAPEWFGTGPKLAYIAIVRLVETLLGNVFIWSGAIFYGVYDRGDELWGISPLQDQGLAGAVMMIEGSLVTITALAWLFLRLAQEGELRQELLERGLDPRAVRRAVRYGRAQELRRTPLKSELDAHERRPPRRPGRLLDRTEPALLPRAARAARLHADRRGRGRARRDDLVPRGRRLRGRPPPGAERGRRATATGSACITSPSMRPRASSSTSAPSGSSRWA